MTRQDTIQGRAEEFLEKVAESGVSYSRKSDSTGFRARMYYPEESPPQLDDVLIQEWTTGGYHGASCWGGEPERFEGEPEPEFNDLDSLLTQISPQVTFLQYKQIAKVIEYSERESRDYYGNSEEFGVKTIRLGDLLIKLQELNLL